MHGVRAIMSRVFYYAEGHGLWEEGRRSPASKAKLGKRRYTYERRILSTGYPLDSPDPNL